LRHHPHSRHVWLAV